ncbi:hypothetical protein [Oceanobacillus kimchii]|uniref:Regulatory protein YycH domain-containing protein n=1 Tax=Oceanobacillus kimchii TaxID=746691 RepID=A0ABQ5TF88_9BACI|nr:hypothetical protein [Oceanobacillus kimchii]GLO64846.1 hypothetical protein MACH08_06300 [Oceanobacillus kimchii]
MKHIKKYWGLWAIIITSTIAIVIYYVHMETSKINLEWKTVSGEEKIVEDLSIKGHLFTPYQEDYFSSTPNNFERSSQENVLLSNGLSIYQHERLNRFIDEYQSFMRGKSMDDSLYHETDEKIIYTSVDDEEENLLIELLDKQTKEVYKFEYPFENIEGSYISVNSTEYVEDELYIIISSLDINGEAGENYEYYLYTIDMKNNQLVEERKIIGKEDQEKTDIIQLIDDTFTENQKVVMFEKYNSPELISYTNENGEYVSERSMDDSDVEDVRQLFLLDLINNEKIEIPNTIALGSNHIIRNQFVYYLREEAEARYIEQYNINKQEIDTIATLNGEDTGYGTLLQEKNSYMYIANLNSNLEINLEVINIENGDSSYKGHIVVSELSEQLLKEQIQIMPQELEFRY